MFLTSALTRTRADALKILHAAHDAAAAGPLVADVLRRDDRRVVVDEHRFDVPGRVFVVGGGKGGAAMAEACLDALDDLIDVGIVAIPGGTGARWLGPIELLEAGHPTPDEGGRAAATRVLALADAAGAGDLVLCLLSGGGSALLASPAQGISFEEKRTVNDLLVKSGASIHEINAVRKHLSQIKGGRLAQRAAPAQVVSLIISDVVGNDLATVASGPTVPDPTTYADALAVLTRHGLTDTAPAAIVAALRTGAAGERPETPKGEAALGAPVLNLMIGSNETAVIGAARAARQLGYRVALRVESLTGEAREGGARLAVEGLRAGLRRRDPRPLCLLAGGETTVTVVGDGVGGRTLEAALGAARELAGAPDTTLFVGATTDGRDGPSEAAGAFADARTLARATALGLDVDEALARNDSFPVLTALADLINTGSTGTNVADIYFILSE